jgi:small subunit ribosomal protein S20
VANIKSQKKRNKTNEKARLRNKSIRSELKTAVRAVQDSVAAGDAAAAQTKAAEAGQLLDKAVSKGVIHKNQASNRKSGVAKLANSISQS